MHDQSSFYSKLVGLKKIIYFVQSSFDGKAMGFQKDCLKIHYIYATRHR